LSDRKWRRVEALQGLFLDVLLAELRGGLGGRALDGVRAADLLLQMGRMDLLLANRVCIEDGQELAPGGSRTPAQLLELAQPALDAAVASRGVWLAEGPQTYLVAQQLSSQEWRQAGLRALGCLAWLCAEKRYSSPNLDLLVPSVCSRPSWPQEVAALLAELPEEAGVQLLAALLARAGPFARELAAARLCSLVAQTLPAAAGRASAGTSGLTARQLGALLARCPRLELQQLLDDAWPELDDVVLAGRQPGARERAIQGLLLGLASAFTPGQVAAYCLRTTDEAQLGLQRALDAGMEGAAPAGGLPAACWRAACCLLAGCLLPAGGLPAACWRAACCLLAGCLLLLHAAYLAGCLVPAGRPPAATACRAWGALSCTDVCWQLLLLATGPLRPRELAQLASRLQPTPGSRTAPPAAVFAGKGELAACLLDAWLAKVQEQPGPEQRQLLAHLRSSYPSQMATGWASAGQPGLQQVALQLEARLALGEWDDSPADQAVERQLEPALNAAGPAAGLVQLVQVRRPRPAA
jgi:hypothetical protein